MGRTAGLGVIVGVVLQTVAFAAIPVGIRDDVLGAGPLAWAWLIGWVLSFGIGCTALIVGRGPLR